jgi:hypothetical protein
VHASGAPWSVQSSLAGRGYLVGLIQVYGRIRTTFAVAASWKNIFGQKHYAVSHVTAFCDLIGIQPALALQQLQTEPGPIVTHPNRQVQW